MYEAIEYQHCRVIDSKLSAQGKASSNPGSSALTAKANSLQHAISIAGCLAASRALIRKLRVNCV